MTERERARESGHAASVGQGDLDSVLAWSPSVWVYREDGNYKVTGHTHRHEKSRDCEMEREEERERESMVLAWGNVLLASSWNHLIRVRVGAH